MEAISKPTLKRLSIVLPTHVCHLLKCGELTIYDLLELLTNTASKVVVSSDENAAAMENFALSLANWSEEVLAEIGKALEEGASAKFVLGDGDVKWKNLSEEVQQAIEAAVITGSVDIKDIYITKEGQIVIEFADEELDDVVGSAPFAKDVYKELPMPGPSTIDTPPTSTDKSSLGGLMTCQDYEDIQNLKKYMPYVDDDGYLDINGEKFVLTKVEKPHVDTYEYSDIKVLSIIYNTNSDGTAVNADGSGKAPKSVTYTAKKQQIRDGEVYGDKVDITETVSTGVNNLNAKLNWFVDSTVGANINSSTGVITCNPSTKGYKSSIGNVSVDIVIGTTHTAPASRGSVAVLQEAATASANKSSITLPYNPTSDVVVTMTLTGGAAVTGYALSPSSSDIATLVWDSKNKKLTVKGKLNTNTTERSAEIIITTNIAMSDGTNKQITIPVSQAAGKIEVLAYYGKSAFMPTSVEGGNSIVVGSGGIEVGITSVLDDGDKYHWVAIPSSESLELVSCVDEEGENIKPTIMTSTAITGYVLYYKKSTANIQNTTNFKFQ